MDIKSFSHKGLKKLYLEDNEAGVDTQIANKLRTRLAYIENMATITALLKPKHLWRAHQLKGNRAGTWALDVTANRRLTFKIDKDDAIIELDLEDYH